MKHQTTGWTSIWKQTIFGAIIAQAHPIAPCQNALQDDSFAKSKTNTNNQMNRAIIVPGRRRTLKTEHTRNVNSIEISSLGETETERRWLNFRRLLCAANRGSERIRAIDFNLNEMKWNEIEWCAIYANILSDHKCCLLPEHKIFISIEWNSKRTHNDFEISFEKWVPHHHHHHHQEEWGQKKIIRKIGFFRVSPSPNREKMVQFWNITIAVICIQIKVSFRCSCAEIVTAAAAAAATVIVIVVCRWCLWCSV